MLVLHHRPLWDQVSITALRYGVIKYNWHKPVGVIIIIIIIKIIIRVIVLAIKRDHSSRSNRWGWPLPDLL